MKAVPATDKRPRGSFWAVMGEEFSMTTIIAVLSSHVFEYEVVTVLLPDYKETYSAFTLKLPNFDKNRF